MFTIAQAHGKTPINEEIAHHDNYGVWCFECGNSLKTNWDDKKNVYYYSCIQETCIHHYLTNPK